MKLTTLADVRELVERHLLPEHAERETWRYVADLLHRAACGGDIDEAVIALRLLLLFEPIHLPITTGCARITAALDRVWDAPQDGCDASDVLVFGKPLMLALLALLASGALFRGGAGQPASTGPQLEPGQGARGLLSGLGGLLTKLQHAGAGHVANSWVGLGQNQPVSPGQLGSALGPDIIKALVQKSGLSEEEVTTQLSQALPGVVDQLTPSGRFPTVAELSRML